MYVDIGNKI